MLLLMLQDNTERNKQELMKCLEHIPKPSRMYFWEGGTIQRIVIVRS